MYRSEKQHIEHFWVVGLNYKKTDATIRGLFAVGHEQYEKLLADAPARGVHDMFVLSTCNRTEIYGFGDDAGQLAALLCSGGHGDVATFSEVCYSKNGMDAIAHLYQVAAGLDSQILGDYEILGQIKTAVKYAKANDRIGAFMERLVNSVLQASKAVKTQTVLSGGTVSVSFAAVQYIKQYLETNNRTEAKNKIVVVGTGKIGRVTCRNFVDYLHTKDIVLINRTEETAVKLATELGLRHAPFAEMEAELANADIVVVSTSAQDPVIVKQHLQGKGTKLVIDMSVPTNVAEDARGLPGITFVDVDTLSKIKDETLQVRKAEVPKALEIIAEHIAEFEAWYEMRKQVPVLKEVKNKLKTIQIDPHLLDEATTPVQDQKIQKVINTMATKMRRDYTPGCHFITAINDYIA
jgi:glutamyl-tRNA reductase